MFEFSTTDSLVDVPRYHGGTFIHYLKYVFKDLYNQKFNYTVYGKPNSLIYDYASKNYK